MLKEITVFVVVKTIHVTKECFYCWSFSCHCFSRSFLPGEKQKENALQGIAKAIFWYFFASTWENIRSMIFFMFPPYFPRVFSQLKDIKKNRTIKFMQRRHQRKIQIIFTHKFSKKNEENEYFWLKLFWSYWEIRFKSIDWTFGWWFNTENDVSIRCVENSKSLATLFGGKLKISKKELLCTTWH